MTPAPSDMSVTPEQPTDFDKLLANLEPAAIKGESEWANVALLSAAVSLKRIADALTSDSPFKQPLNQYGENIAECIEGQFMRSQNYG